MKPHQPLTIESFDDELFIKYFSRFYQKLYELEESKHLPPKFSYALKDLATHFDVFEKLPSRNSFSGSDSSFSFRFKEPSQPAYAPKPSSCENSIIPLNRTVCVSTLTNYTTSGATKPAESSGKIQIRIPLRRGFGGGCRTKPPSTKNSVSSAGAGSKHPGHDRYKLAIKNRPQTKAFNRSSAMGKYCNLHAQDHSLKNDGRFSVTESRVKTASCTTSIIQNSPAIGTGTLWGKSTAAPGFAKESPAKEKFVHIAMRNKYGRKTKATCVLGNRFTLL